MFLQLFARIASPGARGDKVRLALQTNTAGVILAAGVGKRAPAKRAERMCDRLNLLPACGAKIFSVPPMDTTGARPATRRIEPIHQPVEAIRECLVCRELHRTEGNLANPARQWQKQRTVVGNNRGSYPRRKSCAKDQASTTSEWPVISLGWLSPSSCKTVGATSMAVPWLRRDFVRSSSTRITGTRLVVCAVCGMPVS